MNTDSPTSQSPRVVKPSSGWFQSCLNRLKVGQKIGVGFTLLLCVTLAGTGFGVIVGERIQRQSWQKEDDAQEELDLLTQVQNHLLGIRIHQQNLLDSLDKPTQFQAEYTEMREYLAILQKYWPTVKIMLIEEEEEIAHASPEMRASLLQAYADLQAIPDNTLERFSQDIDRVIAQIHPLPLTTPADIEAAEDKLRQVSRGSEALQLNRLTHDLNAFVEWSQTESERAEREQRLANQLRLKIILASMVASVLIAGVLSIYLSRSIAHPLQKVEQVARQVTQDSNFDLQATVETKDEIASLADSLNALIRRVKQLLAEQQAIASQQLLQSEKMSSLGRMVAGVSHEINNPVNFIYGNLSHISGYIDELFDLIQTYQSEIPNPPARVQSKAEEIELEFIQEDLPKILGSMQVGADRTRQIVLSLRNFSRLDESAAHLVDLHDCLDSTLLILNNRIKKEIEIKRNYGSIPTIEGYMGSLYQVFMNILSNAIDALEEQPPSHPKVITITTAQPNDQQVTITLADSGGGIPLENQEKIFEQFFTTKPVGVGTGLGLAISRQIIEMKHHGEITCQSEVGKGTTFTITLPLQQSDSSLDNQSSLILA